MSNPKGAMEGQTMTEHASESVVHLLDVAESRLRIAGAYAEARRRQPWWHVRSHLSLWRTERFYRQWAHSLFMKAGHSGRHLDHEEGA